MGGSSAQGTLPPASTLVDPSLGPGSSDSRVGPIFPNKRASNVSKWALKNPNAACLGAQLFCASEPPISQHMFSSAVELVVSPQHPSNKLIQGHCNLLLSAHSLNLSSDLILSPFQTWNIKYPQCPTHNSPISPFGGSAQQSGLVHPRYMLLAQSYPAH